MNKCFLMELAAVLQKRKEADPAQSYSARLYHAGQGAILKKLGEEAIEVIIASQSGQPETIIHELADLWFHSLILLGYHDLSPEAVLAELQRRFGQSGIAEKESRTK